MNIIRTDRLHLVPAPADFIQLLVANKYALAGDLLNVNVPVGWPVDDDARAGLSFHLEALQRDPAELLWRIRLMVLRSDRTVIGSINLKGPPDESGTVEVGWGVSPAHRRRGLAGEASAAVVKWVCAQPRVRRIIATILADNLASIHVAERLGMNASGEFRRNLPVWSLDVSKAASKLN